MSRTAALARLALLAATAVWGVSFAINQRALADLPVFHLLAFRFSLATLVLLVPLLVSRVRGRPAGSAGAVRRYLRPARLRGADRAANRLSGVGEPGLVRDGLALGGFLFAGFALQTLGLLWTTPSHSAFLTSLAVVMVPPLAWLTGALSRPGGPAPPAFPPAATGRPAPARTARAADRSPAPSARRPVSTCSTSRLPAGPGRSPARRHLARAGPSAAATP